MSLISKIYDELKVKWPNLNVQFERKTGVDFINITGVGYGRNFVMLITVFDDAPNIMLITGGFTINSFLYGREPGLYKGMCSDLDGITQFKGWEIKNDAALHEMSFKVKDDKENFENLKEIIAVFFKAIVKAMAIVEEFEVIFRKEHKRTDAEEAVRL